MDHFAIAMNFPTTALLAFSLRKGQPSVLFRFTPEECGEWAYCLAQNGRSTRIPDFS